MGAARSVAGLAPHAELAPCGIIDIRLVVESLLQVGDMAIDAHVVRGLLNARPVQGIAWREFLSGVEIEPALAAG